jgi:hypothetical protein
MYRGVGRIHMNRGRVGEERGGKEMDGCLLTGTWHHIALLSKALNQVKHNYEIHDTEMLAIIQGLEVWQHYLEGMQHPIKIWTDYKNEYFRVAEKLNQQQARWLLYLSRFNLTLHHQPGRSMGKPNTLLHRADHRSEQGNVMFHIFPVLEPLITGLCHL